MDLRTFLEIRKVAMDWFHLHVLWRPLIHLWLDPTETLSFSSSLRLPPARPHCHAGSSGNLLWTPWAEEIQENVLREEGQGRGSSTHHRARPAVLLVHRRPDGWPKGRPEAAWAFRGPSVLCAPRQPCRQLRALLGCLGAAKWGQWARAFVLFVCMRM